MIAEGGYGCIFHPSIPCKLTEEPNEEFALKSYFTIFDTNSSLGYLVIIEYVLNV